MSLPPLVRWDYDVMAAAGLAAKPSSLAHLRPTDWLGRARLDHAPIALRSPRIRDRRVAFDFDVRGPV